MSIAERVKKMLTGKSPSSAAEAAAEVTRERAPHDRLTAFEQLHEKRLGKAAKAASGAHTASERALAQADNIFKNIAAARGR